MKDWYREYRRLLLRTRFVGIIGSVALMLIVTGELGALYIAISVYEQPTLPDHIWWEVFGTVVTAFCLVATFSARIVVMLRRDSSEWLRIGSWLLIAVLFTGYFVFLVEPSSTEVCSENGICYGIYSTHRQDRIELAALLFFPASLFRFFATGALAFLNLKLKLK